MRRDELRTYRLPAGIWQPDLVQRRADYRKRQILHLEQERASLIVEEGRVPLNQDARAIWSIVDHLSGTNAQRATRIQELTRDLFLLRCGYQLLNIPSVDNPNGRVLSLVPIHPSRIVGTITQTVLRSGTLTISEWRTIIDGFTSGHHHMVCATCEEPVLRFVDYRKAIELNLLRRGRMQMTEPAQLREERAYDQFEAYPKEAVQIEYRTIADGPTGAPITHCPCCGTRLHDETIREVNA